ncbi:MAG: acetyl-CoA carboxylase biotin carboxyl carrier protein [Solirubrobacterales bacterium]|jgi:acetyl-CoA carboxylase biotin carboxyl carrier protein|nr:acetyl-CoA carboxylase biotin carboxyl carrier protein [Solirubrobacterales bacterium]
MEMSPETIKALLDAFERSDWREMVVTVGEDRLHVSKDPLPDAVVAPPAVAPAGQAAPAAGPVAAVPPPAAVAKASSPVGPPTAPPTAEAEPTDGVKIESPSVGLFWRAPSPGAPPFVELGQKVAAGDTVAIVEVMKLMNHVASPVDGVVTAILVENGGAVEYGQTIVVVDPEG